MRKVDGAKVPNPIALFWVAKVLTTAMGEATSDYAVHRFDPVLAVLAAAAVFAVCLAVQLFTPHYNAWIYWLAVVMVAVFGTMAADVLHIKFHVPYQASTVLFAVVLAVVFWTWWRVEGTLSIHSIVTRQREGFYWAAVLATFAMGTALGDLTAVTFKLGYLGAGVLFAVLFAIPGIAYRFFGLNGILAFWASYVVTRPLGASFADYFAKSVHGGLGYGDGEVAAVLTVLIVVVVAYMARTRREVQVVGTLAFED